MTSFKDNKRLQNFREHYSEYTTSMAFSGLGLYLIISNSNNFILFIIGAFFVGMGIMDYLKNYEKIIKKELKGGITNNEKNRS